MICEYQGLLETFCCKSEYFKCAHDVKSVVWLSMRLDDVTVIVCVSVGERVPRGSSVIAGTAG